ncbi:MAG: hypothetical protein WC047_00160 [Kiritimatiellales bacterium]
MADLIDRGVLLSELNTCSACYYGDSAHIGDVMEVVRDMPTVDAVEVVRCHECRYSLRIPVKHSGRIDAGEMMACRLGRGENDAISHLDIVPYDGYCDAGERKEGNDAAD